LFSFSGRVGVVFILIAQLYRQGNLSLSALLDCPDGLMMVAVQTRLPKIKKRPDAMHPALNMQSIFALIKQTTIFRNFYDRPMASYRPDFQILLFS